MKKTIITLFALAGMASAATTEETFEPLTSEWNCTGERYTDRMLQDTTAGKIYTNDPWWKRPYATYDFAEAITISNQEESIKFSFTIDLSLKNAYNSLLTVAFKGSAGDAASTILMGYGGNYEAGTNTHFRSAVVENNSADAYLFGTNWNEDKYNCTTSTTMGVLSGTVDEGGYTNITTTYEGTIAWSESDNAFTLELVQAENSAKFVLGESYSLEGFSIAMDGNSDTGRKDYLEVSNMTITATTVPEPTTATLSLLALAGLAARRRRK